MADAQTTTPRKSEKLDRLHGAIENMDALAQEGMSEIASIARLARHSLEISDGHLHLEDVANALSTIIVKASDIENCIGVQAEEVGCNYVNAAQRRRMDALRAWFEASLKTRQALGELQS